MVVFNFIHGVVSFYICILFRKYGREHGQFIMEYFIHQLIVIFVVVLSSCV